MTTEAAIKNSKIVAGIKRLIFKCHYMALEIDVNRNNREAIKALREIAEKLEEIIS